MKSAITDSLIPRIEQQISDIFNGTSVAPLTFSIGRAVIDPRLNWDGSAADRWIETGSHSLYDATIGQLNEPLISDHTVTPDPTDTIYVRNENTIDSPFEFTYFLYDKTKPWRTFQFFAENDQLNGSDEKTRMLTDYLSTYTASPRRSGWINPNSFNRRVLASAFFEMPVDEFVRESLRSAEQLNKNDALKLADLVAENRLYRSRKALSDKLAMLNADNYVRINNILGGTPWQTEALLRNGTGLFDPRDNSFALLIAAQLGTDINDNGIINDNEILSTQKAVVYIWRDPGPGHGTGRAACCFFGLSDSLQSSLRSDGKTWGKILEAFKP